MSKKRYELNVELKDIPTEDFDIDEFEVEERVLFDDYVQINWKAISYTSDEVRKEVMSCRNTLINAYTEWLAIGADLDYKHLFREVK